MRHRLIFFIVLLLLLSGCRCKKETVSTELAAATEISALQYRKLDSLMNTHNESWTLRITYYPPHDSIVGGSSSVSSAGSGAVRSIEISASSEDDTRVYNVADSVSVASSEKVDARTEEKKASRKTDWVAIVSLILTFALLRIAFSIVNKSMPS